MRFLILYFFTPLIIGVLMLFSSAASLFFFFGHMFPSTTVFVPFHSKCVVWKPFLFMLTAQSSLGFHCLITGGQLVAKIRNHHMYSYMPLVGGL